MAVLLEYSLSDGGVNTGDSIISSACSINETKDYDIRELFSFDLNSDGSFDLGSEEFYDNVSSTSTPSAVRCSDLQQRQDYDTDDSGFCENLVSDNDLLQMSNLHLGDESYCENIANLRRSDIFPLPKLCLLSHFDECNETEAKVVASAPPTSYERCETIKKKAEVVDTVPSERLSGRRQRSPDAAVERCSRHRLSLDSFAESRSENDRPIRRSSGSFITTHSAGLPPPVLHGPSQTDLLSLSLANEPLSHGANVPHQKPSHDNRVLEPSPAVDKVLNPSSHTDRVFDPSPVADVDVVLKENLQCILATFAPPSIGQLIGRKIGLDFVDIISELHNKSMLLIIRHICSYLADIDLCR